MPEVSRRKRAAFALVVLGASSLVSFGVAEAFLRGYDRWRLEPPPPAPERLDLLQPNPHGTGSYRLKPDVRLETNFGRRRIPIRTNRHGMRWREVALEKEPGRRRIAILGDSFAFGCWADTVEGSLAGVLEAGLSRRWEVLNFGVGGYGYADMELLLREEVVRFAPDHVIVATYNGNDFRDTFLGLDRERIVGGAAELDEAGIRRKVPPELIRPDPPAPAAEAKPRGWARLALYRHLAPLLGLVDLTQDFTPSRNFLMLTFWSRVPYPPAALRARDESLATLARMDAVAAAHQARLAVVAIPTREQVYSQRTAGADFDMAFPQIYVQVFARERGIPYLDLLPAFRAHVREENARLYVTGDIHLNDEGHALAGGLIREWFQCCIRPAAVDAPATEKRTPIDQR